MVKSVWCNDHRTHNKIGGLILSVSQMMKKRPVFWWNSDIAEQRKRCHKARRAYTRKIKKAGVAGSTAERQLYRDERKALSSKILESKEQHWRDLCAKVDGDPWGLPYKIVMRKLMRRRPIPGLELPGRLEEIVRTLFPTRNTSERTILAVDEEELERSKFTTAELVAVARCLPNGKAPGPDGIPNEILKAAVLMHPEYFAALFNSCIKSSYFPIDWKKARLVLLHKPGRPLDNPTAYRPLCMINATSKLFEKLITRRLRAHLQGAGHQAPNQFGFRPGRSTIDAMARLRSIVQEAGGRGYAYNKFVGMLTLDVKNAFNSASWDAILQALVKTETPKHLRNILGQYLLNRQITYHRADGMECAVDMSCGVPQGSVLGPDLWNLLYDDLLKIRLPEGTEIIAFADDVAVVCTAEVPFLLEERLVTAMRDIVSWMEDHGLELALEKTEAIVFTNRYKRNTMEIIFPPHTFASTRCVKYLGVHFDPRLHFGEHATLAAKRAAEASRWLTQLLPNLRGCKQSTRRLLASVVTSRLLYGAPIWYSTIAAKALSTMESAYRRILLRVACCYRTTSYAAASVVASMLPLALLAEERMNLYSGLQKEAAREIALSKWQRSWEAPTQNGRWTFRLIKDVKPWIQRKHGEVSFHLSQVLTNHGCFNQYLMKYGKRETDECAHCGASPDSAEHAVFECDAWHHWRHEACIYLGVDQLTPDNMVSTMLVSKEAWTRVDELITKIMMRREAEERRLERERPGV